MKRALNFWTLLLIVIFTAASTAVIFSNSNARYAFSRFTGAPAFDTFRSPILPSIAANPINGHLYMTYPDWPTSTPANPNIYFLQSTNSGTNWSQPFQMNWSTNSSTTDRWEPTLTVKPDGTKLFTAWYDRRADPGSNFLIQTYGVFANLPITGTNNFATNVVLSTVAFPPVFSGTQTNLGEYDPVYPPQFDTLDSRFCGSFYGNYRQEAGDYSGATSDNGFVYYAWTDNRNTATNHSVVRHQRDVRAVRVSWPR